MTAINNNDNGPTFDDKEYKMPDTNADVYNFNELSLCESLLVQIEFLNTMSDADYPNKSYAIDQKQEIYDDHCK